MAGVFGAPLGATLPVAAAAGALGAPVAGAVGMAAAGPPSGALAGLDPETARMAQAFAAGILLVAESLNNSQDCRQKPLRDGFTNLGRWVRNKLFPPPKRATVKTAYQFYMQEHRPAFAAQIAADPTVAVADRNKTISKRLGASWNGIKENPAARAPYDAMHEAAKAGQLGDGDDGDVTPTAGGAGGAVAPPAVGPPAVGPPAATAGYPPATAGYPPATAGYPAATGYPVGGLPAAQPFAGVAGGLLAGAAPGIPGAL